MTHRTHRYFHYDPDSGKSTPVHPVQVEGGEILIPLDAYQQIKREIYGLENFHPEVADATIETWEKEDD